MRLTVRRVMGLVVLMALGLAGLRHTLLYWGPSEVIVLASMVLVATNILAWFQRARWQVFWIGFGLAGWAYMTLSLGPQLAEHLPTTWFLDRLHHLLYGDAPPYHGFNDPFLSAQWHGKAFREGGQSLFSLVFGLLGGLLAVLLVPARDRDALPDPPDGTILNPRWRDLTRGLR